MIIQINENAEVFVDGVPYKPCSKETPMGRWDNTDAFLAACGAADALVKSREGLWLSIADVNTFQDFLIERGYAIMPIVQEDASRIYWQIPTTFPKEEGIYFCKTEEGKKKMFYYQNKLWYDAGIVVKESFLWLNDEI